MNPEDLLTSAFWIGIAVILGLILNSTLSFGCLAPERAGVAGEARVRRDMSAQAPEQKCDGTCRGPVSDGCRAVWMGTVYVCRDNGPPNHWWYVQDPEFAGRRVVP